MKLTPYAELLSMGKEAIAQVLLPVRINSANKKAELEVAKIEEAIAVGEAELKNFCSEPELDFIKIIDKKDKLALLERKKRMMSEIVSELFPKP